MKLFKSIWVVVFVFSSMITHAQEEANKQILFTNANVWDGTSEDLLMGVDVLVEGNKIKAIGSDLQTSEGAMTLDATGKTIIPGLIDMHQHLMLHGGTSNGTYEWDAYAQGAQANLMMNKLLYMGYTTIRDIGGNSLSLSRAVRSGYLTGPRIYSAGPVISQTGGHGDWGSYNDGPHDIDYQEKVQNTFVVDGVAECMKATRWNFRNGAAYIKIMGGGGVASIYDPLNATQLSLEEMKAVVEVANDYGSYVAIHAYHDRSYNRALDAGVRSFEHGFLISEETVKRMAKTENVCWSWQPFGSYTLFAGGFPDWFTPDMIAKGTAVNKGAVTVPPLMKKHGVLVVLGSDMFGAEVKFALTNILSAKEVPNTGFTDYDIMKMATSNAGIVLSWSGPGRDYYKEAPLGVLQENGWADLLIIDGNPVEDVTVLGKTENVKVVMKDGVIYKNILVEPNDQNYKPIPQEFRVD
ncbi:MAG: amidohydrolase family protein [Schleiferiaceae bacterium]